MHTHARVAVSSFLVLSLTVAAVGVAVGQEQVYTDPDHVDDDYRFQGEYRGWQRSRPSSRSSEPVGLQVIARGDGKFDATVYYGGLPGEGWFGKGARIDVSGETLDDLVELHGPQYRIEVDGEQAAVFTQDGRRAGLLHKVWRVSPTMGASPPAGAVVLFDGTGVDLLKNGRITEEGYLDKGADTREAYGDFRMHVEFRCPYQPVARSQGRGNSGVYLQSRYEVQILDSFGLEGIENDCASLYRTRRPDFNMSFPPLTWQTFDIDFTSAKFDEKGNKIADMRISVWHNGVLVHNNVEIPNKTGAGKPEGPDPLPTRFQDHRDPVVFRNIWLVLKEPSEKPSADWVQAQSLQPPMPIPPQRGVAFHKGQP